MVRFFFFWSELLRCHTSVSLGPGWLGSKPVVRGARWGHQPSNHFFFFLFLFLYSYSRSRIGKKKKKKSATKLPGESGRCQSAHSHAELRGLISKVTTPVWACRGFTWAFKKCVDVSQFRGCILQRSIWRPVQSQDRVKAVPTRSLLQMQPTNAPSFPSFWRTHCYDPLWPHVPRFFVCPKTTTLRGVDRHFRGPGWQKSWRKSKTCGDATRKCSKRLDRPIQSTQLTRSLCMTRLRRPQRPGPSKDADPELRHNMYLSFCECFPPAHLKYPNVEHCEGYSLQRLFNPTTLHLFIFLNRWCM